MKMGSSQDSHSQHNKNLCHLIHVVNDVIVVEVSDLSCIMKKQIPDFCQTF